MHARYVVINNAKDIEEMMKQLEEDIPNAAQAATTVTEIQQKIIQNKKLLKKYKQTLHPAMKTDIDNITKKSQDHVG